MIITEKEKKRGITRNEKGEKVYQNPGMNIMLEYRNNIVGWNDKMQPIFRKPKKNRSIRGILKKKKRKKRKTVV